MTPALSIVIPTKNRHAQCADTVRSVLHFQHDFELVVFDSSDDEALTAHMKAMADDERLRIVRSASNRLNMTECFEAAVAEAAGTFVCMIGDDDGVTPALFDWVTRSQEEGYSSVTTDPRTYALYNWPDIRSKYFGDRAAGKLFIHLADVPQAAPADTGAAVHQFLRSAGQGCDALPRVYHGLIRRDVLEAMRQSYGRCFDGVSPDVSFSYMAALCSKRHLVIREPLTISGASAVSNAGRSAMRIHKGDLWSDPHMKNFQNEPWPKVVPEFFSVETVWAQATLAALSRTGGSDTVRFNLHKLYALLLLRHPDNFKNVWRAMRHAARANTAPQLRWLPFVGVLVLAAVTHVAGGVKKVMRKLLGAPSTKTFDAESIVDASRVVQRELKGSAQ